MKLKKGKVVEKMAKKHVAKKKKKNIASVTTEEFFNQDFENLNLSDDEEESMSSFKTVNKTKNNSDKNKNNLNKSKNNLNKNKNNLNKNKNNLNNSENNTNKCENNSNKSENNSENDSDSEDNNLDPLEHKKSLMNLKDTDPEFFNYLIKNDTKLLDFNVDDEETNENDSKHVPDYDLEIASDESDFEEDEIEFTGDVTKVTLKLIKTWEEKIQNDKSAETIKQVVEAFHAALETVSDSEKRTTQYKVEGGTIFNGIVQLCIIQLPQAFKTYLKIGNETRFEAHKAKRFPKVKKVLKSYLSDLIKVLENVSSAHIIIVLLKHLHQMLQYTHSFSSLRKSLLRMLLKYWSTGEEETIRVVAFLCIIKIATSQTSVLGSLQKTMYIKYVENSKFVSPTTLPGINFMRRSLIEMYVLDFNFSYYNAFLYVRQLAIHLRNALTLKKKEHFQAVYNWQYINSLRFWNELISLSKRDTLMHNLEYPLVQITIGVIKLIATSRYYPLRFHCIRMLINISKESGTFIPYLPFIIEILESYDFNRKHKIVSMKPISLMCLLKVSKSQSQENGYKDAIIENIYELLLESAAKDSNTIYFPDLYIFSIIKIKAFLKKYQITKYCRKMKHLLDKIEENRKFIETEREKREFDLGNMKDIETWEKKIYNLGTPINKFYESWRKFHESQQMKLVTLNDEISDFKLPTIKKCKRSNKQMESEGDSDLDVPVEEMEKRLKKAKKSKKKMKKGINTDNIELPMDDDADIVQDIKSSDWD